IEPPTPETQVGPVREDACDVGLHSRSAFNALACCVVMEDDTWRVSGVDCIQIMVVPSLVVTGDNRTDFVVDQDANPTTTRPAPVGFTKRSRGAIAEL